MKKTTMQVTEVSPRPAPAGKGVQAVWMREFTTLFESSVAHAFIFHFNTRDYVARDTTLREYIVKAFPNKRVIAFYNLAEGITFAKPEMRAAFDEICELDKQSADPAANVLTSLGLNDATTPTQEQPLPRTPGKAIPLLETLLRRGVRAGEDAFIGECVVVLEYAEAICPNADMAVMSPEDRAVLVTLERLGADQDLAQKGNALLLVTENLGDLHPALRRASAKYEQIEIALPDLQDRKRFIQQLLERRAETLAEDLTVDAFASATAMLNRMHIEDIFLRASEADGVITRELVKERKRSIVAAEFGEVIEMMEPNFGFDDIGGLQNVKDFALRSIVRPMLDGRKQRVPMGVLFTGPAGTGKTALAQAIARESGIPCVILNPAKLFGQYVGNTERNLDKALRAIVALGKAIVFIDELDQTINRGGGGDSGVSNRFFKRLLEFMSDTTHRGDIVFLAATNRPDLIDAALRRPGRFDRKIPFLVPDANDREQIVRVMARRYGLELAETCDLREVVAKSDKWTGAELEAAAVKAVELVEDEGLDGCAAMLEAVKRLRPSTSDIEFQTLLAVQECNDVDLLPASYRERLQDRNKLAEQIEALAPRGRTRREM